MAGQRPTSKQRVRHALRVYDATETLAALKATGGGEPADEDGLTPRHWAVLRARGVDRQTYREISLTLGVSVSTVSRLLNEALERLDKVPAETLERVRDFDMAMLDELQAVFMPRARAGLVAAADLLIRIQRARSRALGYAKQPETTIPDGECDVPTWTALDDVELKAGAGTAEDDDDLDDAIAGALGGDDDGS